MSIGICDTCGATAELRFLMCKSCFLDFKCQVQEWAESEKGEEE